MFNKLYDYYYSNYKKLLIIPIILLILNSSVIIHSWITTGSIISMDSSLTGGVTFTFNYAEEININGLENALINTLQTSDVEVIILRSDLTSTIIGYEVITHEGVSKSIIEESVESYLNIELNTEDVSYGTQSSIMGENFLQDSFKLFIISFLLMSLVSYLYFKNILPAITITLSTLMDFIGIIAMLNFLGFKVSTATIGALLMIIGYSTDSDILLSTNILKRKDKTLKKRLENTLKTELTMSLAALTTFSIMFFLSSVETIQHIALVLLLGILFDFINTYFLTASVQRMFKRRMS